MDEWERNCYLLLLAYEERTIWNVKANPGNFKCDSSIVASSNSSLEIVLNSRIRRNKE